ncbi:MAG: histidine phosphotransferase [Rhodospirillales bacterium]|nr:histidine phosphotransferase [Rhodospirillales bacterium]
MNDLDVAAMLCSMMCHDLVSPVGALANGVEILEEEEDKKIKEQALGLLSHSAQEASRRLQFFRLAFGASGGIGAQINLDDAKRVLEGLFENGKIDLTWNAPGLSLEKTIVKLLLNMAFAGAESLSRGGAVNVDVTVGGDNADENSDSSEIVISVTVSGEKANIKEDGRGLLTGQADTSDLTTRSVQPYYTWRLAEQLGAKIKIDTSSENNISLITTISSNNQN